MPCAASRKAQTAGAAAGVTPAPPLGASAVREDSVILDHDASIRDCEHDVGCAGCIVGVLNQFKCERGKALQISEFRPESAQVVDASSECSIFSGRSRWQIHCWHRTLRAAGTMVFTPLAASNQRQTCDVLSGWPQRLLQGYTRAGACLEHLPNTLPGRGHGLSILRCLR